MWQIFLCFLALTQARPDDDSIEVVYGGYKKYPIPIASTYKFIPTVPRKGVIVDVPTPFFKTADKPAESYSAVDISAGVKYSETKPDISVDVPTPFHKTAHKHFESYGAVDKSAGVQHTETEPDVVVTHAEKPEVYAHQATKPEGHHIYPQYTPLFYKVDFDDDHDDIFDNYKYVGPMTYSTYGARNPVYAKYSVEIDDDFDDIGFVKPVVYRSHGDALPAPIRTYKVDIDDDDYRKAVLFRKLGVNPKVYSAGAYHVKYDDDLYDFDDDDK